MSSFEKHEENGQESQVSNFSRAYRKAIPYLNLVYVLIASPIMFGFLGWYADKYFQTKPIFTVLGIFAGLGIGFYSFFKSLKQIEKNNN
jgi:ATP synthase protein I